MLSGNVVLVWIATDLYQGYMDSFVLMYLMNKWHDPSLININLRYSYYKFISDSVPVNYCKPTNRSNAEIYNCL